MTVLDLLSRLSGVSGQAPNWTAKCPAHDDGRASLSLSEGYGGKVLLHCHAGCGFSAVTGAIGLPPGALTSAHGNRSQPVIAATYDYRDEAGALLFQVVRYAPKGFMQRRPDGAGGWVWDLKGVRRVLYRLPEVTAASPKRAVFIVEGEKDADRLAKLRLFATTNAGGAGKWRPEYSEGLRGRPVFVVPDNDVPGRSHAEEVARSLQGVAASVRLLELPGLPPKGDVSDWLDAGGTVEELRGIARAPADWTPMPRQTGGFKLTTVTDLLDEPEEETRWLVEGMLPSGGISIVAAKPKVGKSTLARQLATCVSRGAPFLGREANRGSVVYLALEEKRGEVRAHFQAMGATEAEIHVHFGGAPKNAMGELRTLTERLRPALVIVDPLFRMARVKDANDYAQVTAALEPLIALARETGAHVLVVHHAGKGERSGSDAILGSTAILGSVDTAVLMKRGERYRTVHTVQRYGQDLDEAVLDFDPESRTVSLGESKAAADECRIGSEIEAALRDKDAPLTEEALLIEVEGRLGLKRKALRERVKAGTVERLGAGKRGDPFTYRFISRSLVPDIDREREYENPRTDVTTSTDSTNACSRGRAISEVIGNGQQGDGNELFAADGVVL